MIQIGKAAMLNRKHLLVHKFILTDYGVYFLRFFAIRFFTASESIIYAPVMVESTVEVPEEDRTSITPVTSEAMTLLMSVALTPVNIERIPVAMLPSPSSDFVSPERTVALTALNAL